MSRADDLTRLRSEMETLHASRAAFVSGMKQTVADMRKGNMSEVAERKRSVGETLAAFRSDHADMAREQRKALDANERRRKQEDKEAHAGRVAFVAEMKQTVAGLRKGFQAENAAARGAWSGATPAERRSHGGGRTAS